MRRGLAATLLAVAFVLPACASAPGPRAPAPCTPAFAPADGWLGGDAAWSVPLPGGEAGARRTLWLFGDSFVLGDGNGAGQPADRAGAAFVHNSIAVSRCDDGRFEIDYHWRSDADGRPVAFFDSGRDDRWWWLFDGFVHDGRLYVGLLEVEPAPPGGPLRMPFVLAGMRLARIDDPRAPPARWRPRMLTLADSREAFPAGAMVPDGDHLLLFSFMAMRDGRQPRFLARLPLAALDTQGDDLSPHVETLTRDGAWIPGFLPAAARIVMPDNATEMSVHRHPELPPEARWVAVYGAPVQTRDDGSGPAEPSAVVFARHAPAPEGPWSPRLPVHRIAELAPVEGAHDPRTLCYAAKEHPAFARPGELLVTYVCSYTTLPGEEQWAALKRLQRDMEIYLPRVIRVPVPAPLRRPPEGGPGY